MMSCDFDGLTSHTCDFFFFFLALNPVFVPAR